MLFLKYGSQQKGGFFISKTSSGTERTKPDADGEIDKSPRWKVCKLHIVAFAILIVSVFIGVREIKITENISFLLLPITYAIVIGMLVYLSKHIKWIGDEEAKIAEGIMAILLGVIISKLAISSGESIYMIFNVGPALILQLLGDSCTIIALPVALLLGFRREAVGMTSSICRDPNVAIVIDRYGVKSPESRGVLFIYILGPIIGTLYMSFLASLCVTLLPMHPYAYAMASGVGSASMNAAGLVPLVNMYPSMSTQLEAFAGCSNVLSSAFGIYMFLFISLPLTEKFYSWLSPVLCRGQGIDFDDDLIGDGDGGNNPFGFEMDSLKKLWRCFWYFQ